MRLNAPKKVVFWITVVLAVLGVLGAVGLVPLLGGMTAFWLVLAAFVVLAMGTMMKGM